MTDGRLLRTGDLVALLQANDPDGERIVRFELPLAEGDPLTLSSGYPEEAEHLEERFFVPLGSVSLCMQNTRQTSEGDRNILRLTLADREE